METDAALLWTKALQVLTDILSEITVLRYFGGSVGLSLIDNTLQISLPEEKNINELAPFHAIITSSLIKAGASPDIHFTFLQEVKHLPETASFLSEETGSGSETLLTNLTFDLFVEGPSNQFPLAMARYVAQHPGDDTSNTNPLFMYGPTGVGKTHLLHAIGNEAKKTSPKLTVLYTTSANLMDEYMHQWTAGDQAKKDFRAKYRTPDILLVDDIQYMAGKKGLQDEFFNIFNALKDDKKQIVMTSDRAPNEIPELMDRLVSRFQSGICADVDIPAYETRLNILNMKLSAYPEIKLSNEVKDFIARKVSSSVRALEGALSTTVNYARIFPANQVTSAITVDILEKSLLKNFIQQEEAIIHLTCEDIQRAVCKHYSVSKESLLSESRERDVAFPRQVAMFLCRKLTSSSLPDIGRAFNRKHPTVSHSCTVINNFYKSNDSDTLSALKAITGILGKSISDLN